MPNYIKRDLYGGLPAISLEIDLSFFLKEKEINEWSFAGRARGTSTKTPSYAPGRRSNALSRRQGFGGLSATGEIRRSNQFITFGVEARLRIHPQAEPVVFCVGG